MNESSICIVSEILLSSSSDWTDKIPMVVRAGFIFIQGTVGLQTSGRERLMEKVASTQSQVTSYSDISKMDGVMVTFFA